ncbi:hypothetical protein JHK87_027815 [Glycine soja]|nr:hypothetical protein JHK87_027815 [Glycine soja]
MFSELIVARKLNSIVKIDDQKETWKIVVRVIYMWTIPRSPKSIVELILVDKKKCFSATVESNPTLLGSITLAKHILPLSHSQLDGILFKDLSLIQLSSTRLGKQHIKTE